jgi:hypothetical protein
MDMLVTRLSDTRYRVVAGKKTYYVKMVKAASEDFDHWNRTGEPPEWHVDAGDGPELVRGGSTPEHAVHLFLNPQPIGTPFSTRPPYNYYAPGAPGVPVPPGATP